MTTNPPLGKKFTLESVSSLASFAKRATNWGNVKPQETPSTTTTTPPRPLPSPPVKNQDTTSTENTQTKLDPHNETSAPNPEKATLQPPPPPLQQSLTSSTASKHPPPKSDFDFRFGFSSLFGNTNSSTSHADSLLSFVGEDGIKGSSSSGSKGKKKKKVIAKKLILDLKNIIYEVASLETEYLPDHIEPCENLAFRIERTLEHKLKDELEVRNFLSEVTLWDFFENLPNCVPLIPPGDDFIHILLPQFDPSKKKKENDPKNLTDTNDDDQVLDIETINLNEQKENLKEDLELIINTIQELNEVQTPLGRGRVFIRLGLNEGMLGTWLRLLVYDKTHLELCYQPSSLMRDEVQQTVVLSAIESLSIFKFGFILDNPLLDRIKHYHLKNENEEDRLKISTIPAPPKDSNNSLSSFTFFTVTPPPPQVPVSSPTLGRSTSLDELYSSKGTKTFRSNSSSSSPKPERKSDSVKSDSDLPQNSANILRAGKKKQKEPVIVIEVMEAEKKGGSESNLSQLTGFPEDVDHELQKFKDSEEYYWNDKWSHLDLTEFDRNQKSKEAAERTKKEMEIKLEKEREDQMKKEREWTKKRDKEREEAKRKAREKAKEEREREEREEREREELRQREEKERREKAKIDELERQRVEEMQKGDQKKDQTDSDNSKLPNKDPLANSPNILSTLLSSLPTTKISAPSVTPFLLPLSPKAISLPPWVTGDNSNSDTIIEGSPPIESLLFHPLQFQKSFIPAPPSLPRWIPKPPPLPVIPITQSMLLSKLNPYRPPTPEPKPIQEEKIVEDPKIAEEKKIKEEKEIEDQKNQKIEDEKTKKRLLEEWKDNIESSLIDAYEKIEEDLKQQKEKQRLLEIERQKELERKREQEKLEQELAEQQSYQQGDEGFILFPLSEPSNDPEPKKGDQTPQEQRRAISSTSSAPTSPVQISPPNVPPPSNPFPGSSSLKNLSGTLLFMNRSPQQPSQSSTSSNSTSDIPGSPSLRRSETSSVPSSPALSKSRKIGTASISSFTKGISNSINSTISISNSFSDTLSSSISGTQHHHANDIVDKGEQDPEKRKKRRVRKTPWITHIKEPQENSKCPTCEKELEPSLLGVMSLFKTSARFCYYTGQYFCQNCHTNQHSIIPAYVIHKWEFKKYPVSIASYKLIEKKYYQPIINLGVSNPILPTQIRILAHVKKLRKELDLMQKIHLHDCKKLSLNHLFEQSEKEYFFTSLDLYSLSDLVSLQLPLNHPLPPFAAPLSSSQSQHPLSADVGGKLLPLLETIYQQCSNHIKSSCKRCYGRGSSCIFCESDQYVFEFEIDKIYKCPKCGALAHLECHKKYIAKNPEESTFCNKCVKMKELEQRKNNTSDFISLLCENPPPEKL